MYKLGIMRHIVLRLSKVTVNMTTSPPSFKCRESTFSFIHPTWSPSCSPSHLALQNQWASHPAGCSSRHLSPPRHGSKGHRSVVDPSSIAQNTPSHSLRSVSESSHYQLPWNSLKKKIKHLLTRLTSKKKNSFPHHSSFIYLSLIAAVKDFPWR